MGQTFERWSFVIGASVSAIPLAVLAAWLLTRARQRAGHPHATRTAVADVVMMVGTAPWIWMILTPTGGRGGVEFVPLRDLFTLAPNEVLPQIGGNLLVFAALGAMLPVRSARFASPVRIVGLAAVASLTVETLQYVLHLGRVSSIDDVLVNSLGALVFSLLTHPWWAGRPAVLP
ncbi:VanZ family protein [Nocardia sp. NPDC052566]|uniref:VanZ family protein n=1 Tax=Nocardia sp. NPDC052566 TaxID=3364330 RepID=UPI0037C73F02